MRNALAIALMLQAVIADQDLGVQIAGEKHDQQDDDDQADEPTKGRVAKSGGVTPAGIDTDAADQGEHENND